MSGSQPLEVRSGPALPSLSHLLPCQGLQAETDLLHSSRHRAGPCLHTHKVIADQQLFCPGASGPGIALAAPGEGSLEPGPFHLSVSGWPGSSSVTPTSSLLRWLSVGLQSLSCFPASELLRQPACRYDTYLSLTTTP